MSNRLYIYASDAQNSNAQVDYLVEAAYDLPSFFYPLFMGQSKLVNNDVFADAAQGIAFFEKFYDFIDKHASTLINDKKAWKKSRKKITLELTKFAAYKWFYLEMSDVFTMSETPYKLQAQEVLRQIESGLQIIQDAMDADNPQMLDLLVDSRGTGVAEFKTYFNLSGAEYGWSYFAAYYDRSEASTLPEIFEQNGVFGLKNSKGKILTPALYTNIFDFDEHSNLAIAEKNHKFIYLNVQGSVEIDGDFDEAYDFYINYEPKKQVAVAKQGLLYGLINRKGQWVLKPSWDDLRGLSDNGELIAAQKDKLWGVIDYAGKLVHAPSFQYQPVPNSENSALYYTCGPEGGAALFYLTLNWKSFKLNALETMESFSSSPDIKVVLGQGKNSLYGLMNQDGEMLLQTVYSQIEAHGDHGIYRVKKDKKCGLFCAKNGWVLNAEFDSLEATLQSGSMNLSAPLWVARRGRQYGVFNAHKRVWILDCVHGKIQAFVKNVLGVVHVAPPQEAGVWVHDADTGAALAGPYVSLSDCAGSLSFAAVLAFTDEAVFTVGQTGLVKPLTAHQADSFVLHMPSKSEFAGEYYFTMAQGSLIKKHFSKKLKNNDLLGQGNSLSEQGQYKQALDIFLQLAADGDPGGYVNAGYILASQPEFEDLVLARRYYCLASDAGEPQGMNNLACCYRDGEGGPKDIAQAIALFTQADAKNNLNASVNLAGIYYDDGDRQNLALALQLYLKAYRHDPHPIEVAFLYDNLLSDYTSALKYYEFAGKTGSGYALNRIGLMWQEGELGTVDAKKAQAYFQKAMHCETTEAYAGLNMAKLLIRSDPAAAKAAWQFALDHEDEVEGLIEFGQAQGW